MKKLLTLAAGYAAGLAVAMKYRKDNGTSKLATDPGKSKVDAFIDEVVDIHKTAYGDARGYVTTNLDEVKDLGDLKEKVTTKMSWLADQAEDAIVALKDRSIEKKEALEDTAKAKASYLSDTIVDKLALWIDSAKGKLDTVHATVKSKLDTDEITPEKPVAKKPPVKKPVAKKSV